MEREERNRNNTQNDKGHIKIVCSQPIVADKEITVNSPDWVKNVELKSKD